jgi:hypothetical protein
MMRMEIQRADMLLVEIQLVDIQLVEIQLEPGRICIHEESQ